MSGLLSPPCTCGAGEDSEPEIETTRRIPEPERRQGKEIEVGRHSQERRYRANQASSDRRNDASSVQTSSGGLEGQPAHNIIYY